MARVLLSFDEGAPDSLIEASPGVTTSSVATERGAALRMEAAPGGSPGTLTLKAPDGHWDVADRRYVGVELYNPTAEEVQVSLEVNSQGADAYFNRNETMTVLLPGESKTLEALIVRLPLTDDDPLGRYFAGLTGVVGGEYSSGMLGLPGGLTWHWYRIDPAQVTQVVVSVDGGKAGGVVEIGRVVAEGRYDPPSEKELQSGFAPFVDEFGQYRHHDWPCKIRPADDLKTARKAEEKDLAGTPCGPDRNGYGAWKAGPLMTATGRFYPIKHEGKWWLVDPEGRLFWSHGLDCIGLDHAATRIKGREHYFADLPGDGSPLSQFYQERDGERFGYSFSAANLYRKYGDDWRAIAIDRIHERLRSWGMNTVANWSSPEVYLKRRTPYALDIHYSSRGIEGNEKLPDPFDEGFRAAVRESIGHRSESADDPWCIGYFVDNELNWQQDLATPLQVAAAPPDQPAKLRLVEDLRAKYETIEALNAAWGTKHASWEALLQCREAPDVEKSRGDLAAFFERLAEAYFTVCREEVKAASPTLLYLGCRIHQINPLVVRVAAKYCDVLSLNCYAYDVGRVAIPEDADVPIIIGEWHFGALDRGPLHPGLRSVQDQSERGVMYKSYLRSALSHPLFVGAHWFQYGDQATTGRDDGENCQVGFVDTCDTPYAETVAACREVGYTMYEYRMRGTR